MDALKSCDNIIEVILSSAKKFQKIEVIFMISSWSDAIVFLRLGLWMGTRTYLLYSGLENRMDAAKTLVSFSKKETK